MPETLEKLRPDRDLQCFFFQPSAIAALSETSSTGFTVSGTWRQQFDWAVVEWNRDNVFEHPAFRNLPDGDLSGLMLSYDETRDNCVPIDSDLFPTVDWPYLRIWAEDSGTETIYYVPVREHAEPIAGSYSSAYAEFTLSGTVVAGDFIGLGYLGLHYTYQLTASDTLESALQTIVDGMNASWSPLLKATRSSTTIRASYTNGSEIGDAETGANGNRFALYSYSTGAAVWDSPGQMFTNGVSPSQWRITLDFGSLHGLIRDEFGVLGTTTVAIPTNKIRKMRWTWAAELQAGPFERSEFAIVVSNWTVTGAGRTYSVAGRGAWRIEDDDLAAAYAGTWEVGRGNFSGGTIHSTVTPGSSVTVEYRASGTHTLWIGTRYTNSGAMVGISVDGSSLGSMHLHVPQEDVLIRWPAGEYGSGLHSVTLTHGGSSGQDFYFDYIELAVPTTVLPTFPSLPEVTLATDWDTDHSVAIAPERTAWFVHSMGFHGRQNHYVGALLFYELLCAGNVFASGSVTFGGVADADAMVSVTVGPSGGATTVSRVLHPGDTPSSVALSFAQEFNRGYTGLWATALGGVLTIRSRQLGTVGNANTLNASTTSSVLSISVSGTSFSGGVDGTWRTDLAATPRLNRAMRDWTRSFMAALEGYGIDAVCAFSTELKHGDPSVGAGIAQRGPGGDPVLLPTPAVQTNFSPTSLEFWKQVHADCAVLLDEAGLVPYLQFGEQQWWYFPHDGLGTTFSGMPFYDTWTLSEFELRYGRPMAVFTTNTSDPGDYPEEMEFLSGLIGEFTDAVMSHVRTSLPLTRFEVLYPFDVNQTEFNKAINFPVAHWTPAALDCLKTEGLGLTFTRNLAASEVGIDMGQALGFAANRRSHLVGIGDATAPWLKEARVAQGKGFESVVLFALDQFCLIGHKLPLPSTARRAIRVRR